MALHVGGTGGPATRARRSTLRAALLAVFVLLPIIPASRAEAVAPPIRLYVFAGQSNMVGYSTIAAELAAVDPALTTPVRTVRFWGPVDDYANRWATLQAPTEIVQPAYHSGFGPEISAAPILAARHPRATIAFVKLARNGTNLNFDWDPQNIIGLYSRLIDRVLIAKRQLEMQTGSAVQVAGFFWMQGESDAMRKRPAETYATNLSRFITSVRSHLSAPNMPFVIGRIGNLKRISGLFRYSDTVRRSQEEVAATVPYTYIASTDGLHRDPGSPIHFSTRGTVDLGRRFVSRRFPL